ncbi:MAG TPA: amidohydrolase family protein, partial [Chloroflexota bacterium]
STNDFAGKSMAQVAEELGKDQLDAFLDLALAEDLDTSFQTVSLMIDPEVSRTIMSSPHVLIGSSDAGAHVQFRADFGYGTSLLGSWVREQGTLTFEEAIYKLTFHVASVFGIEGRGLLRPGYAADVVIFDPETVGPCEPEMVEDFPGNTSRVIRRSKGVVCTIVNGQPIYEDGRLTGALPGQVLRGAAYTRGPSNT